MARRIDLTDETTSAAPALACAPTWQRKSLTPTRKHGFVELLRRCYSNRHDLVTPLVRVLQRIEANDQSGPTVVQSAPPSPRWLGGNLATGDPDHMAEQYLAGETAPALATRYGISLKSVRRILQAEGVRKRL